MVPLDAAGEALSLRNPDDINQVARLKKTGVYPLTHLYRVNVRRFEFPEMPQHSHLLEMPLLGLVESLGGAKAKLYRIIAVFVHPFHLGDEARARLYGGDRHDLAVLTEQLGHPYFSANKPR